MIHSTELLLFSYFTLRNSFNKYLCIISALWIINLLSPKWFLCFITNLHFCSNNKYVTEGLCWRFCPVYFLLCSLFHQKKGLKKWRKMFFISCNKLFSFPRYSSVCSSAPPSPKFADSKWGRSEGKKEIQKI